MVNLRRHVTECFLKTVPSATCVLLDNIKCLLKVYTKGTGFMKSAVPGWVALEEEEEDWGEGAEIRKTMLFRKAAKKVHSFKKVQILRRRGRVGGGKGY